MGKILFRFKQLNSTSEYLADLLSKSTPIEGTVISTWNQTNGRGQIGSIWFSGTDKNLSFSLLLCPKFLLPTQQFWLNCAVSLGIYDALVQIVPVGIKIKWPNDIYFEHKKLAGVLIQNALFAKGIKNANIGIGVNVNETDFPDNLPNPISLRMITGVSHDLEKLEFLILESIEKRYLQLKNMQYDRLKVEYSSCLYRWQQSSRFEAFGQVFEAKIIDVLENGQICLETSAGLKRFDFKELSYLFA